MSLKKALSFIMLSLTALLFLLGLMFFIITLFFLKELSWDAIITLFCACITIFISCHVWIVKETTPNYISIKNLFYTKKIYYKNLSFIGIRHALCSTNFGQALIKCKRKNIISLIVIIKDFECIQRLKQVQQELIDKKVT